MRTAGPLSARVRLRHACLQTLLALHLSACSPAPAGQVWTPLWSTPLASPDPPLAGGGRLFLRGFAPGTSEPYRLHALAEDTGKEIWVSDPLGRADQGELRLTSDGLLLVPNGPGCLVLEASTGKVRAELMVPPVVDGQTGRLQLATLPKAGGECWNGRYFYLDDGFLVAFDVARQTRLWKSRATGQMVRCLAGKVVTYSREGLSLHAWEDGRMLWTQPLQIEPEAWMRWEGDTFYVSALEFAGKERVPMPTLTALDPKSGQARWRYAPFDRWLAADAKRIWVAGLASIRHAGADFNAGLEPSTGRELWRKPWYVNGLVEGHRVYEAHHDFRFDLGKQWTGDKRGSKQSGGIQAPEEVSSCFLEAKNADSGQVEWHSEVLAKTEMSGPTLADGILYVSALAQMQGGRSAVMAFRIP